MNEQRIERLIDFLRVLAELKAAGAQCNSEINETLEILRKELLEK